MCRKTSSQLIQQSGRLRVDLSSRYYVQSAWRTIYTFKQQSKFVYNAAKTLLLVCCFGSSARVRAL
jgi:hypothetical protein